MGARKNRKIKKRCSGINSASFMFPMLLVLIVSACLTSWFADQRCSQQQKALNAEEAELRALEEEYSRELVRWETMTSPKNLEKELLRHGLAMDRPEAGQIVLLDAAGRPKGGQISMARLAKRRARQTAVASNTRKDARSGRR